ncbi:hypothetical protein [Segatella copri]|uniref:Uncharacterized protein n=1 Tax=Segatella copri TaxID=165179 RepID=A0A6G1VLJ4_9BACT|nr:hypothetical protein [Segatella copri]MQN60294.1 hypothetical protein [Segatella copri]MQP14309.1 hypothetical protein [Segatella copri]
MAVEYDKNDLQTQFEGIRDERRLQANTAYRIGTAFLSLLHFASDEMHTTIEELLKKIEGKYLSKVKDDEAAGLITFLRGLRVGAGYKFDENGNILADSIDANNLNIGRGYKFDENGDIISRDIEAHDINANDLSVGGNSVFAGDLSSPDFVAGFLTGKGWRLKNEPIENAAGVLENKYNLELDNLIVRGSMRIFEMIISQLLGENDNRIFTAMMEVDHFDAESGRVYLDTKEGRMYNSFRKGDYIMVQQYNGLPSEENDHYVTKNYELLVKEVGTEGEGEDRLAWVTFENFTSSMAGATPEKLIKKRDTFVRVDNVSDPDRKGIIQVMTVGSDTPYIDIVHGMKTNPDSALKGRIGNLKGIRHPILGQLKGFGEYLNNLYAVGEFVLSRTGESIDTKFQVLENMFSSRFSKTSYELTNEKNYLENGQFLEQITDSENKIIAGWDIDTTDESVFWFDASGLPVMVNGNPTASGNRKVSLEKVDGRQILRVQNCGIRQKNALIRQPGTHKEYVAGEKSSAELPPTEAGYTDVQDKLYISVRIYAKTAGKLTIGFADCEEVRGKQNTLQQRTVNVAYSGAWKTIPIEGVWNGTGDFVIQYTGDCYLAIASLTDEPLSELSKTVSTQIVQTANNIKLLGENIDAVNKKAVKVGIELDAEKGEIRQYVDSKDAKNREDTSSQITQTASNITSTVDKQLKDQYGNITSEYQSAISQSAEKISLKVSAAQSAADKAQTSANAAQGTADTAVSKVAELKVTVDGISSTVDKKISNAKGEITKEYQSAISQSAEKISLKVSAAQSAADKAQTSANAAQGTADTAVSKVAELKVTVDGISSTVDKKISNAKGEITKEYQSAISQSAEKISLKVSAAQSAADKAKTAAGSAQSTADAAKSSVAELKVTVNNISSTVANKADTSTLNSKVSALNSSISSAKQSAIDTVNARIDGGVGEFYQQSSLPSFSSLSWTDPKCQRHAGALWYATYPAPSGYTAGHLYRFTVMRGTGSKWEDVDDSIDTATTVTQNSDGWSVAAGMFSGQTLTAKGIATITPTVNSLCNSRIDDRKNEIRSGLVTTADFAALQTTVAGHTASISTSVQKDANGYITNATIKADRIKLEGLTTVNNNFKVLADGSVECVNADISGDLKVTNMRYAANVVVNGKVACSCITAWGTYVLPDLEEGEIMRLEVFNPMITRSTPPVTLKATNGVFLENSTSYMSGVEKITVYGWVQLMGTKKMNKTFWVFQDLG